jgi:hypothetical protein
MTRPNAELAYRVLDHIDAHPEQHDQSDFVRRPAGTSSLTAESMPCGTTACFAGWTVLLSGYTLDFGYQHWPTVEDDGRRVDVDDLAAELLGIGTRGVIDDAPHALFYEARNRDELADQIEEIFGPRPHPAEDSAGVCAGSRGERRG